MSRTAEHNNLANRKKTNKARRVVLVFIAFLVALCLLLAAYFGFYGNGLYAPMQPPYQEAFAARPPAQKQDAAFVDAEWNPDVVNFLVLGLDKGTPAEETRSTMHQADTIIFCSFHTKTGEISLLSIPRGILLSAPFFDLYGEVAYYLEEPLCNLHAMGRTPEEAAGLMLSGVQTVLGGVPISGILTVEWQIVEKITEALGGVEVECFYDIAHHYQVPAGQPVLLDGPAAMQYVRERSLPGMDGSNQTRMMRQGSFLLAMLAQTRQRMAENPFFSITLMQAASGYYTSTLSLRGTTYLATTFLRKGQLSLSTLKGAEDGNIVTPDFEYLNAYLTRVCCKPAQQ